MVSLRTLTPPRASARRDFSRVSRRAPVVVQRMTRAYNQPPASRWQPWRWRVIGTLTVVVVGSVLYSPLFAIKNVIVDNTPSHQSELRITNIVQSIINQAGVSPLPQWNLMFFSTSRARQAIASEFYITGLTFERQWPNVLRIVAPQDTVAALWQAAATYLVSGQGILVQQLGDEPPPKLLTVREVTPTEHKLGDRVAPASTLQFLQKLHAGWQTELPTTTLTYVSYDPTALPTLEAYTDKGWYVLLSAEQDLATQLTATRLLLQEKIKDDAPRLEYIDVRFGSRLYYKLH